MEQQNIQVRMNDQSLRTEYANHVMIVHSKEEFLFDFFSVFPPQGVHLDRIALSPAHAKRLWAALSEQIKIYEKENGQIQEMPQLSKKIGFQVE